MHLIYNWFYLTGNTKLNGLLNIAQTVTIWLKTKSSHYGNKTEIAHSFLKQHWPGEYINKIRKTVLTSQFMLAITDFTNKWFSTNRVHKMFHKTTISLHSLLLHWITILLHTDITVFVFNTATAFIFLTGTPEEVGDGVAQSLALYIEWHGLGAHLALQQRWWCTLKKIIKMVGSYPTLKPSPSVLQKSPPTAHWAHKTWGTGTMCINTLTRQTRIIHIMQDVTVMVCFFPV